jgi:hypothetical protein
MIMKAKVTCRPARNFPVHDMLVKIVVRLSQGSSSVQCSAVQLREDVSAVSEHWNCCVITSEQRTDLRSVSGSGQWAVFAPDIHNDHIMYLSVLRHNKLNQNRKKNLNR